MRSPDEFRIGSVRFKVKANTVALCGLSFIIVTVYCYVFLQYIQSDTFATSTIDKAPVYSPQLTLILSQQRSGSSWLGSIFDSDPDIFFLFEPLHAKIYQSAALQLSTVEAQVEILNNICTCNFEGSLPSYGILEQSSVGMRAQTLLYSIDNAYLRSECMQAKSRVAKVVKITDVEVLQRLQTTYPGCRLDIIHLVRDPRGSINSRMGTFQRFFPGDVTTSNFTAAEVGAAARVICAERERLVKGLTHFNSAERIITFKYEDLAEDPLSSATQLFSQLQLKLNKHVYNYIIESSRASSTESGGYDTKKQSKAVYNKWQSTMDRAHLAAATTSCYKLLETLGYPHQIP